MMFYYGQELKTRMDQKIGNFEGFTMLNVKATSQFTGIIEEKLITFCLVKMVETSEIKTFYPNDLEFLN